ncbi:hypothetical protein [Psychrobacillus sp. OK032]|uniref:hypothetical protein n=1 Tax=Psychrobacillus sp. OK032 TaxID=1884358 RepID=UPI0008B03B92|nr:hypothetical protein [Psychrobacillus sp. OK032]SER88131.1 hypothetical protein SAMN05518872_102477 [Psychrobacillus sp. OK032]
MTNLSTQIEGDLIALLDDHYSLPETYDNALDAQIHGWYANPPNVYPKKPYFSPSSLGDCPRSLYVKAKGAKKDGFRKQPHQGRWQAIGTKIGDIIQRDLLFIERNYERLTGNKPRFKFERDTQGRPMFEDFAKTNKLVEHNGETFYLFGAPDGIMTYTTDDGAEIRVGLEVKSKQGTPAKTSHYSMREAEPKHAMQTVAYAHMFDCDYYVVLYVNAAKQAWHMTDEQYAKTPDIRAFCQQITPEMKAELFDKPAYITKAVRESTPPPMDLDNFTFNNFKTACALSLTDDEFNAIKTQVSAVWKSSLPDRVKRDYSGAYEFITKTRNGGGQ